MGTAIFRYIQRVYCWCKARIHRSPTVISCLPQVPKVLQIVRMVAEDVLDITARSGGHGMPEIMAIESNFYFLPNGLP